MHLLETCVWLACDVELVVHVAIDLMVFGFLSFMLPHDVLVFVPFDAKLTYGREPPTTWDFIYLGAGGLGAGGYA